jgi:hypothetical protein
MKTRSQQKANATHVPLSREKKLKKENPTTCQPNKNDSTGEGDDSVLISKPCDPCSAVMRSDACPGANSMDPNGCILNLCSVLTTSYVILSGLGHLAVLPKEVLQLILTKAGSHKSARSLSHGFKDLFDETQTTLVVGEPKRIYPSDIGQLIADVIKSTKALVSVTVKGLATHDGTKPILHIASSLAALKDLRTLVISDNDMGRSFARYLAPLLNQLTGLQALEMSCCSIVPSSLPYLTISMSALTRLQTLKLRRNSLGPDGMSSLAPSLMVLTGLQTLNLSWNDLESAETLIEAYLKTFPTVCIRW